MCVYVKEYYSSPCGDVSWNMLEIHLDALPERSSPCGDVNWNPQFGMIPNINNGSSPCGDVSWNTKTLTADQAKERSSPYGDVNWNRASSCACMSRNTIRLLVGMWVEICWRYIWTRYQNVRLRKETWVEIYVFAVYFISSFSSSPCGDVSWNIQPKSTLGLTSCSSPCGDVNWNGRIPCPYAVLSDRSFPRGDVSWNCSVFAQAKLDKSSSPYGDVNWNEEASKADYFNDVRLRKETWIEI